VRNQTSVSSARATIDHKHATRRTTLGNDLTPAASPIAVAGKRTRVPVTATALAGAVAARHSRVLGGSGLRCKKGFGSGGERHRCLTPSGHGSATGVGERVRRVACKCRFGGGQAAGGALKSAWAGVREPLTGSRKNLREAAGRWQSWRENAAGGGWQKRREAAARERSLEVGAGEFGGGRVAQGGGKGELRA
jgi:hypothetical protein